MFNDGDEDITITGACNNGLTQPELCVLFCWRALPMRHKLEKLCRFFTVLFIQKLCLLMLSQVADKHIDQDNKLFP